MWPRKKKANEFIRIPKVEWEQYRKDIENFIQRHKASLERVKELAKENNDLKSKLQIAEEKLITVDIKEAADLEQTSLVIREMRNEFSRLLQQTEKEIE